MVPSEFAVAATVGIVPGAAVGDMVDIMVDDCAGVPGVRGVLADLVCASTVPQPNRATANSVSIKRRIQVSCACIQVGALAEASPLLKRTTVRSSAIDLVLFLTDLRRRCLDLAP